MEEVFRWCHAEIYAKAAMCKRCRRNKARFNTPGISYWTVLNSNELAVLALKGKCPMFLEDVAVAAATAKPVKEVEKMSKLSFEMALANMKRGKLVRRASLRGVAYRFNDGRLTVWQLVRDSGGAEWWERIHSMGRYFSAADILAEDWEVVE